jgi:hypothetical protein
LHPHWTRSELVASALGYTGEVSGAPGRNFACNLRVRSAALYTLSYGSVMKWCAGAVLPRLPPQCRCGDLLVIYRRMKPRAERGDEMAAPDGFAPSTSRFKVGRSAG